MNIKVAKSSGFCSGVRRAVDAAMNAGRGTYVLGELIHNPDVIAEIGRRGILMAERLSDVPDGGTVIFRSHGVPESFYGEAEARGIKVIDCTCSFVRRTQKIVGSQYAAGRLIVIAGEPTHPEVVGLQGWCKNSAVVINSPELAFGLPEDRELCVVAQTTFSVEKFEKIIENI
ncbi:MAG TPA: bifunctional 4-hydroxy-3-methylbut-2-enyl diphosphate reductase/30S ribosomal protein S1, partial [Candidatus Coproplasma avistercoris]|nr:bifunctional 4-hydroxy-3-methylbut-2-enyl diphosphate reductase/30S ribosomal protein S1 [Candidatus Coproplasma avistercoris]